ncbi:hypothetical protein GBA52_016196 [Prunus armeniaca]|nr:hypothetical protein GBA52_016196 [Prunus armeniaca]
MMTTTITSSETLTHPSLLRPPFSTSTSLFVTSFDCCSSPLIQQISQFFSTFLKFMASQGFEALNRRAVAVVVDPIQSVKGKVVIDAFRLINPNTVMLGQEPRQTTSNRGQLNKPSCQALIHGLNRNYYSLAVNFRMNGLEEKMLLNLHKKKWTDGLTMRQFDSHSKTNEQTLQEMSNLAIKYNNALLEDGDAQPDKLAIANVGRADAKKHLEEHVYNMMSSNIAQTLGTVLDIVAF